MQISKGEITDTQVGIEAPDPPLALYTRLLVTLIAEAGGHGHFWRGGAEAEGRFFP
jgi:hypothetical protein